MTYKESIGRIGKRYHKCALWVVAGMTLLGLLAVNLTGRNDFVTPLAISAVYSIVLSVAYGEAWKAAAKSSAGVLSKFYFAASALRLVLAALVVAAYCVISQERTAIINFAVVFLVFYIATLITDCAFFARVERKLSQKI